MRSTPLKLAPALLLIAYLALPGGAPAAAGTPTCHGKPATVVGTNGDDRIGSEPLGHNPIVVTLGGDDEVVPTSSGTTGKLIVCTGPGRDLVDVNAKGNAFVTKPLIDGGPGRDKVGNFADYISSYLPEMRVFGGPGDDLVRGANNDDRLAGGGGDDVIRGLNSDDVLRGGGGDDRLFGQGDDDFLRGGGGEDVIDGDARRYRKGDDLAVGGTGSDRCEAEIKRGCER